MGYDGVVKIFYGAVIAQEKARKYIEKYHAELHKKLDKDYDDIWEDFLSNELLDVKYEGQIEFTYGGSGETIFLIYSNIVKLYDDKGYNGVIHLTPNMVRYAQLVEEFTLGPMQLCSSFYSSS